MNGRESQTEHISRRWLATIGSAYYTYFHNEVRNIWTAHMTDSFDPYSSSLQYDPQTHGQMNPGRRPDIPNHLVKAILATCFCCLPLGIVAIVFAAQVNGKLDIGDYAGATSASEQANMYGNISIGLGILPIIGMLVIMAIGVIAGGVH